MTGSDLNGGSYAYLIGSKFLLELNYCKVPIGSFHQKVLKSKLLKKIDYVYGQKSSLQIYKGFHALTRSNHTQSTLESTLGSTLESTLRSTVRDTVEGKLESN